MAGGWGRGGGPCHSSGMRRCGRFWAWPEQGEYWENTGRWDNRKGQVMISFCWPLVLSGTIILKKKKKNFPIWRKWIELHFSGCRVCAGDENHLESLLHCSSLGPAHHSIPEAPQRKPRVPREQTLKIFILLLSEAHSFTRALTSMFLYLVT